MITLCEKTTNDMTGWSRGVEEEREQLVQHVRERERERGREGGGGERGRERPALT